MAERGPLDDIADIINGIPPLTRYTLVTTLALSLSMQFGLVSPQQLILQWKPILGSAEVYRLFTNMCLASGFGLLMHLYFLHQNLSFLESSHFAARKGDLIMMFLFVILGLDAIGLALGLPVLTNSFSMAMVTIWSQMNPDQIVTFMFGLQFKASLLPFVMLALDMLTSGSLVTGIVGIIVGHAYHFQESVYPQQYGGRKLLVAPAFLESLVSESGSKTPQTRAGGYTAVPPISSPTSISSGTSGAFKGKGYRLGSE